MKQISNRKVVSEKTGMVYPKSVVPPERKYGLLEYQLEDTRKEVHQHLAALYNCQNNGLLCDNKSIGNARKHLIKTLGELFLGSDWSCEEYC